MIDAIKKGATSGEAIRDYLTVQQDLPALAGPASFAQDGTLDRPLFDSSETWTFQVQVRWWRFTQAD